MDNFYCENVHCGWTGSQDDLVKFERNPGVEVCPMCGCSEIYELGDGVSTDDYRKHERIEVKE